MAPQCSIRFLQVASNNNVTMEFSSSTQVSAVKQKLLASWPSDFDAVNNVDEIVLIHYGKKLGDKLTLAECNVPTDDTITMHLLIRQNQPKSAETEKNPQTVQSNSGSKCRCTIL
eukprot:GFYU01004161.1.p1 GENE.GFYU01004161.1~~GFYU01004161.1.p1  ORF type:complete len:115 (-),score=9.61 GFYU01004161.1:420-764(-)